MFSFTALSILRIHIKVLSIIFISEVKMPKPDDRSEDQKKADNDNHANQCNPNHPEYKEPKK